MFSHITLGTNDWKAVKPFWDAVMAALGIPHFDESDKGGAYGARKGPWVFIGPAYDGEKATYGNGTHIAFQTNDRSAVDAFYKAALDHGGKDEGAPGLRPHYHANYYGAYIRDPDGNKLQAVCHTQSG